MSDTPKQSEPDDDKSLEQSGVEIALRIYRNAVRQTGMAMTELTDIIDTVQRRISARQHLRFHSTMPQLQSAIDNERQAGRLRLIAIRLRDGQERSREEAELIESIKDTYFYRGVSRANTIVHSAFRDLVEINREQTEELKRLMEEDADTSITSASRLERIQQMRREIEMRLATTGVLSTVFDQIGELAKPIQAKLKAKYDL